MLLDIQCDGYGARLDGGGARLDGDQAIGV